MSDRAISKPIFSDSLFLVKNDDVIAHTPPRTRMNLRCRHTANMQHGWDSFIEPAHGSHLKMNDEFLEPEHIIHSDLFTRFWSSNGELLLYDVIPINLDDDLVTSHTVQCNNKDASLCVRSSGRCWPANRLPPVRSDYHSMRFAYADRDAMPLIDSDAVRQMRKFSESHAQKRCRFGACNQMTMEECRESIIEYGTWRGDPKKTGYRVYEWPHDDHFAADAEPVEVLYLYAVSTSLKYGHRLNLSKDSFTWISSDGYTVTMKAWKLAHGFSHRLEGNKDLICAILQHLPCEAELIEMAVVNIGMNLPWPQTETPPWNATAWANQDRYFEPIYNQFDQIRCLKSGDVNNNEWVPCPIIRLFGYVE